jgi:hypothetical protein
MPPATRSSLRHAICSALILAQLAACMTWRPIPGTLDQQVGVEPISRARLELHDGATLPLRDVTVRADSVIGYSENVRERRAVPVADVTSIHRRQFSAVRTTMAVGATAVVALAALAGLVATSTIEER